MLHADVIFYENRQAVFNSLFHNLEDEIHLRRRATPILRGKEVYAKDVHRKFGKIGQKTDEIIRTGLVTKRPRLSASLRPTAISIRQN
jgi:hypothetical protein